MPIDSLLERLRGQGTSAVLARGAASALVVQVLGLGVAYFAQIVLARLLGDPKAYGDYAVTLIWMYLLILPAKIGFDTAALRFVAAYKAQSEWGLLRGFIRRSHQIVLGLSILIAALGGGFVWALWAAGRLRPELLVVCLVVWLVLPFQALLELSSACIRGLKHVVMALAPKTVLRNSFLLGGAVLLAFALGGHLRPAHAMGVHLAAVCLALIISTAFLRRSLPKDVASARPQYETSHWRSVALPLMLVSGFYLLLGQTDVLMLGVMRGNAEAGVYRAASQTAQMVRFGLTAVGVIAAPMISELYTQGRTRELQRMATVAAWLTFATVVPLVGIGIFFARPILSLFGPEFTQGHLVLMVLLSMQSVIAMGGLSDFFMTMTQHQREAAILLGATALCNILLNAFLIPRYGIMGAAAATAATLIINKLTVLVYVYRVIGINSTLLPLPAPR